MRTLSVAHLINPVKVPPENELYWQQPITFKSVANARRFAGKTEKGMKIDVCAVNYPEDDEMVPGGFTRLPHLTRDVSGIQHLTPRRKLPLFADMLDALYAHSDADYFIQTNADIGLMPHFYNTIKRFIEKGHVCFMVNKRLIPKFYHNVEDLPEMYAEPGTLHNGYDCFVFPRELYPKFKLGNICMGIPWSETTLAASMVAYSPNVTVFKNAHITFHIGDSRGWMQQMEYRIFNTNEFAKTLTELMSEKPEMEKHEIIQWLLLKLKYEIQPFYSEACRALCDRTVGVR